MCKPQVQGQGQLHVVLALDINQPFLGPAQNRKILELLPILAHGSLLQAVPLGAVQNDIQRHQSTQPEAGGKDTF